MREPSIMVTILTTSGMVAGALTLLRLAADDMEAAGFPQKAAEMRAWIEISPWLMFKEPKQ